MKRVTLILFTFFLFGGWTHGSNNPLIFAYYFLATSTYGFAQANYAQDIADAQAIGIDGFVVGAGGWTTGGQSFYKTWMTALFAAAAAAANNSDGTKFKVFVSAEVGGGATGVYPADVQDMVNSFKGTVPAGGTGPSNTNYYWYQGLPMLTTSRGELGQDNSTGTCSDGLTYWNSVFTGFSATFYPFFQTTRPVGGQANTNNPTYAQISANWFTNCPWWPTTVNGLAYFTTDGLTINSDTTAGDETLSEEFYAQFMRDQGRLYLAGLSSTYSLTSTVGGFLLADERFGGEGIDKQWASIRGTQKPKWVILYTWNDLSESYITPASPGSMFSYPQYIINPHVALAKLNAYFIQWSKTGAQPAITNDQLFYFYRRQPAALTPSPPTGQTTLFFSLADNVYVTTILTAPATVRVISGGNTTDTSVAAGIVHTRVPFTTGTQTIQLIRSGSTLINLTGDTILSSTSQYQQNYTTGYGTNP